jgi:glycosyltransferase involved in cell wall biosynthesis
MDRAMKIVQIETYDISGGAARAAYRLHKGLLQIGQDCCTLSRYKESKDKSVHCITSDIQKEKFDDIFFLDEVMQHHYINSNRTDISNTIFSLPYPGFDLSGLPLIRHSDIIHLHWISYFQSLVTLEHLFRLGKPVVWTLHDQWVFTGGCHYSAGCKNYRKGCERCPQLKNDPFGLPEAVLKDKKEVFKDINLTIVAPSKWMADRAKESSLLKNFRTEVIPNALEADVFRPLNKAEAKKSIGIDPGATTILFGAEYGTEKRKGFQELMEAIRFCRENEAFQGLVKTNKVRLLCFGKPNDELKKAAIPFISLGYLRSDEKIRAAYSAADIFLLPSLEDNFPNTILESMSCGTPVIAFKVGGVPEVVKNGKTGKIVPAPDTRQMSEAILSLIFDAEQLAVMGRNCRETIERDYTLSIQAHRYVELYQQLIQKKDPTIYTPSEKTGKDRVEISETCQSKKALRVSVETTLGVNFKKIYDKVLFQALKEFGPYARKKWTESEEDRAARLKTIKKLGKQIIDLEADWSARVNTLETLLKESEEDRAARLQIIDKLGKQIIDLEADWSARVNTLETLLKESEEDRKARLDQIIELTNMVKQIQIDQEVCEDKWRQLDSCFVVRNARKMGIIKVMPYEQYVTEKTEGEHLEN